MQNNNKEVKKEGCMYHEEDNYCLNSSYGGGRGLCNTHYTKCSYHVKRGNKTWEDFEKDGICKKSLTQKEKNERQAHPHRTYRMKNRKSKYNL